MPNWEQLSISVAMVAAATWVISTLGVAFFNRMFDTFENHRKDALERERLTFENEKMILEVLGRNAVALERQKDAMDNHRDAIDSFEEALDRFTSVISSAPCREEAGKK